MKKSNKIWPRAFLLFALFSCGTGDKSNQSGINDSFTVDWSQVESKPVPKIKETQGPLVGPSPLNNEVQFGKKSESKQLPSALILGPGVYRTLSHIALLREITAPFEAE